MKSFAFSLLALVGLVSGLAASGAAEESKTKEQTIVGVAAGNPEFSTLVAAIKAAGLTRTLNGDGPFTVFAPTNEAFEKLPKGTLEELLKPENKKKLAAILTYHVARGKVLAADVVKLDKVETLQGQEAKVSVGKRGVKIDGAKVVQTDIMAKNGVIHVIDSVILPKE
jgi:uncharacterized surface protein with fasciclin (FAS1) repeats